MNPVSLQQVLTATKGRAIGFDGRNVEFPAVTLDSRTVRGGELFWAVQGERHNGHDFVSDAFRRGAAACVVQTDEFAVRRSVVRGQLSVGTDDGQLTTDINCVPKQSLGTRKNAAGLTIVVPNSLQAFSKFAHWYRCQHTARIVGVTGSVGKTTTREMIHAVLSTRFAGTQSPENFNNHFGVPLSLLQIERQHTFAVLELAASRRGEIGELAGIAAPQIGVITGIGPAHLAGFGTEENVLHAKAELLEALPRDGLAILAGDDPRVSKLAQRTNCRALLVGEGSHNHLRADNVEIGRNQIRFLVDEEHYEVFCTGRHHVTSALAAITIGREWGMNAAEIAEGLRSFVPVPGRCRIEEIGPWTVIDDTYNANPASAKAACEVLAGFDAPGRKLLVVGDMLELGPHAAEWHRNLGEWAADSRIDYLAAIGQLAKQVVAGALTGGMAPRQVTHCPNFDRLMQVLQRWLQPGDVLLVKGSRATHMERVIARLREDSVAYQAGNSPRVAARASV